MNWWAFNRNSAIYIMNSYWQYSIPSVGFDPATLWIITEYSQRNGWTWISKHLAQVHLCLLSSDCVEVCVESERNILVFYWNSGANSPIHQAINIDQPPRRRFGKSKANYAPSKFGNSSKRRMNRFVSCLCDSSIRIEWDYCCESDTDGEQPTASCFRYIFFLELLFSIEWRVQALYHARNCPQHRIDEEFCKMLAN